jgi:hypothetical protein
MSDWLYEHQGDSLLRWVVAVGYVEAFYLLVVR